VDAGGCIYVCLHGCARQTGRRLFFQYRAGILPLVIWCLDDLFDPLLLSPPGAHPALADSLLAGDLRSGQFVDVLLLPDAIAISHGHFVELHLAAFCGAIFTLILKEHIHWPLICTILLGFAGVILLMQPTLPEDHWVASLMGIASGFFAAIAYINVKQLGNLGETEWLVVFYFTLISTLITGVGLMFTTLNPITWPGLLLLLGIGVTATLAQLAMTRAYHRGVTLVVTSLGYSNVLFASLWGILLWNELLPPIAWWVWIDYSRRIAQRFFEC